MVYYHLKQSYRVKCIIINVHLHLSKLNNICHFSDHFTNLVRSSCKVSLSVKTDTDKETLQDDLTKLVK